MATIPSGLSPEAMANAIRNYVQGGGEPALVRDELMTDHGLTRAAADHVVNDAMRHADPVNLKAPEPRPSCLTCAFWKPYRDDDARRGLGICQRFPPVALKQGTSWPVTGEGDWCGERKDRTLPDFSRGVHEGF